MNNIDKKNYISPRIVATEVELEQGIAAGSGPDSVRSADPQESWIKTDDDNRTLDW
ncbi:hypothetical protein [Sphingobacterium sp.]|uniref:hypothetical protein n=1 Tax=Sphingobacterium sp. TaxID=341027 RepID=UPI00289C3BA9|nr:hypothetical protein [Sphingobacterium sp.]